MISRRSLPMARQSKDDCRGSARTSHKTSRSAQILVIHISSEYKPGFNLSFPERVVSGKRSPSNFLRGPFGNENFLNLLRSSQRDGENSCPLCPSTPPSVLIQPMSSWRLSSKSGLPPPYPECGDTDAGLGWTHCYACFENSSPPNR